jgi:copper transport protein
MAGTLASGIVLAFVLLPRWADLWQSDYGLRLCAKLVAVAVMLLIAALNRLWLTRRAIVGEPGMRRLLRLVLGLDLVAAALATVLAVGLSLGPPPAASLTVPIAHARYDVTLAFTPGTASDNDLALTLVPKAGAAADPKEVEVRLAAPGIEPITRKAERIGPGRYQLQSLPLWIAGPWQVQIGLLIDDFTKVQIGAEVTLTP